MVRITTHKLTCIAGAAAPTVVQATHVSRQRPWQQVTGCVSGWVGLLCLDIGERCN